MARREVRTQQRAALERKPRGRGGNLFTGLFIGVAGGLLLAAGLAWYFYVEPTGFRNAAPTDPQQDPPGRRPEAVISTDPPAMDISPPPPLPLPAQQANRPAPPTTTQKAPDDPGYSFYDILPGDKPAKPQDVNLPREVWWLQVAALKEKKDANSLKAKLALLGLDVKVHPVETGAGTLHRVRVGPFKTEDDALGALDTLAVNDYEPRLFKEKLNP